MKTTLSKASTTTSQLRTTVPAAIVSQLNLKEGNKISWKLDKVNGDWIAIIKIEK